MKIPQTRYGIRAKSVACLAAAAFITASSAVAQDRPSPVGSSAAREYPYRVVGRLLFASGNDDFFGTASTVARRGALTSASNLYDPNAGFSFDIEFERGRNGNHAPQRVSPTRSVILSGYISNADRYGPNSGRAFARDLAVLRFRSTLAGGDRLPVRANLSLLTDAGREKEAIGYSSNRQNGRVIVSAVTTARSREIRPGYYDNNGIVAESGMAGAPLLAATGNGQVLVAIVVSRSSRDTGLRGINGSALRFIERNL